jgi:hypothetical protein
VPSIVLIVLYRIAIIASSLTGYASGLEARHSRLPVYVVGMLVSAVILLIQDLDRLGTGVIEGSQWPTIDTAASMARRLGFGMRDRAREYSSRPSTSVYGS